MSGADHAMVSSFAAVAHSAARSMFRSDTYQTYMEPFEIFGSIKSIISSIFSPFKMAHELMCQSVNCMIRPMLAILRI